MLHTKHKRSTGWLKSALLHSRQIYRCCIALVLTFTLSACGFTMESGLKADAEELVQTETAITSPLPSQTTATPSGTSEQQDERIDPPEPGAPGLLSLAATPVATIAPNPAGKETTHKQSHPLSSDLLFLSGQSLIRWDHITHFGVALAEYIIEFSPNALRKQIALLRSRGVTANGAEL